MKNSINFMKNLIARILIVSLILACSIMPVFASSYPDTQSSGNSSWYVPWQNTSHSIYAGESIGNILRSFAQWNDTGLGALYNRMGGLSSDIQSVVTAIQSIPGSTDYTTILQSIDSKIVDYTTNITSVENKLQSIINNLINVNTGLANIKTDTGNIKTNTDNISSKSTNIDSNIVSLLSQYVNNNVIRTNKQSRDTLTGTLNSTSLDTPLAIRMLSRSNNAPYNDIYSVTGTLSLYDYFHLLNNNLVSIHSDLVTDHTSYNYRYYNDDLTTGTRTIASLQDLLTNLSLDFSKYVSRISYVVADPDTISAKQANKPQEQSILGDFTGSGDASASISDIGTAKDTIKGIKSGLTTGTSASNVIGVFNSNEGYNWFSNTVAQDIDHTNTSALRNTRTSSTPLLDEKMQALYSVMGVIND